MCVCVCVCVLQELEYADDMALVADCMDTLQGFLRALDTSCTEMELCNSAEKTKILAINTSGRPSLQPRDVLLRPVDGLVSVVDGLE